MGRLRVAARAAREARSRAILRDTSRSTSPSRQHFSPRTVTLYLFLNRTRLAFGVGALMLLCLVWHLSSRGTDYRQVKLVEAGGLVMDDEPIKSPPRRLGMATDVSDLSSPGVAGTSLPAKVAFDLRSLAIQGIDAIRTGGAAATRDKLALLLKDLPPKQQTMRFQVCNGFANQRLSVVYGILLAYRLGRTPVLPVLLRDGIQRTDAAVVAQGPNKVPFEEVYDLEFFLHELAKAGIRVLEPHEAPLPSTYTEVELGHLGANVSGALETGYSHVQHLAIDCPLFKMSPPEVNSRTDGPIIWAVLDAMRPAELPYSYVKTMQHAIKQLGSSSGKLSKKYNYLHLRLENDWVEHCKRWSSIPDGVVRDNCYNNTETIDVELRLFAFSTGVPLYVASYWSDVDPGRARKVVARLVESGYRVITSDDVFPEAMKDEDREIRALVEYYVGFGAERFIGNSVSTFAALALLERRHRGQWAAYYNGGNMPIAPYLPVFKLPWVFTYNSWSPKYDYMLKAAVRSAAYFGTLKPYCIFDGNTSSPIGRWLAENNVTMIQHVPAWRTELLRKAQSRMKDNVQHSHLYKNPDMLVSTFQRVDLPAVPVLDQYTYVLYTDADVYFRRPVNLDDFGLPLPRSVSMSYEFDKVFPYNAGVIVANVPTMRHNYKAFLKMMLDNENGLYYPNYGPADQGILNKFYERDLRSQMLKQSFNTKPYNDFDPNSFLVHFHGPKPHEYLQFLETGKCNFTNVCEQGILRSLCNYATEWATHVPEENVGSRLSDMCAWLNNPTLKAAYKKKTGLVSADEVNCKKM